LELRLARGTPAIRFKGKALPPGKYRLTAVAVNVAGQSNTTGVANSRIKK
jgi:hypothetical protein